MKDRSDEGRSLLRLVGFPLSPEEEEAIVASYAQIRESLDALYLTDVNDEPPSLGHRMLPPSPRP